MGMLVSILMRSHNDIAFVQRTLTAFFAQTCDFEYEVVSCDDASTDGTAEIIEGFSQVKRVSRPEGEYYPGRTLNHAIRQCQGEIIVFNNADAVPLNNDWLRQLVPPLREGRADAVYANQLPRPDASELVRKDNLRAFGDGSIAKTWKFFFSLASSAIPREELQRHPFDESMKYSEDVEWAHRRPIRIEYVESAQVEHSHNYTFAQLKKRFYGEGFADGKIFGEVPGMFHIIGAAVKETLRDAVWLLPRPSSWLELPGAPFRRWIQKYYHRKGVLDYFSKRS